MFTAIDHVGIAVADLDEAVEFYRRTFGMEVVHEEVNEEQGVREAMLAVGDSGSCVQLLAPLRPDSPIGKFLDRNGPGVQQVAYRVPDVEAAAAQLRDKGMRLLYDEPKRGTAGSRGNFVPPPATTARRASYPAVACEASSPRRKGHAPCRRSSTPSSPTSSTR